MGWGIGITSLNAPRAHAIGKLQILFGEVPEQEKRLIWGSHKVET